MKEFCGKRKENKENFQKDDYKEKYIRPQATNAFSLKRKMCSDWLVGWVPSIVCTLSKTGDLISKWEYERKRLQNLISAYWNEISSNQYANQAMLRCFQTMKKIFPGFWAYLGWILFSLFASRFFLCPLVQIGIFRASEREPYNCQ